MLSHRSMYALALYGACCAAGCQTPPGFFNFKFWDPSSASTDLKDPEKVHLTYAQFSEQNGDFNTARTSYETALEHNEQSFEAVLGLARLDLLSGKTPQAERNFLKAFELAPTNEVAIEALGQFYLTQDRFVEAAQYLQRGLDLAPGNRRLRYRMGLALARQGNIPAAESHFIQAVGEAEADYNIGLILYEHGEVGPAEQRFLQAVLKKPTLAQAQHWLDTVRQERDPQNMIARRNAASGQQPPPLQVAQAPAGATPPSRGNDSRQQRPLLDPRTLNATQLEQLENSMTPEERTAFRASLQSGGTGLQ
jgi:tetratricopeptide (TPR) repeat protein